MTIRKSIICILVATFALLITAGCSKDRLQIGKLVQNPERFLDKTVQVAGEVTKSYSANLIIADLGAYQVDDGTGRIWVISKTGVPKEGAKVGVKGTVSSGFKFGSEMLGVLIREEARRVQ